MSVGDCSSRGVEWVCGCSVRGGGASGDLNPPLPQAVKPNKTRNTKRSM